MRPWRRPCSVLGDMGTESGVHTLPRLTWGDTEAPFAPPFAEESKRHGRALAAISFWCPKAEHRGWPISVKALGPRPSPPPVHGVLSVIPIISLTGEFEIHHAWCSKSWYLWCWREVAFATRGQGWGQVPRPSAWHLGSCSLRPDPAKLTQTYGAGKRQRFSSNSLPELGKTPPSSLFSSCFTPRITAISHKKRHCTSTAPWDSAFNFHIYL